MFLLIFVVDSVNNLCSSNWTIDNLDCCSPRFGFNCTSITFDGTQRVEYTMTFILSNHSIAINTDWTILNISWGQFKGMRSIDHSVEFAEK